MTLRPFVDQLSRFGELATIDDLKGAAAFVNVVPGTVLGWLSEAAPPKGEAQLRMMHYLDLRGLRVMELNQVPAPAYRLGMYISVGSLTVEEATRELGYAGVKDVYGLLRGADLTSHRANLLAQSLELHAQDAEDRKAALALTVLRAEASPPGEASAAQEDRRPVDPTPREGNTTLIASEVARSILVLSSLVESLILSDDGPAIVTAVELVGRQRVADLVANLQQLSA